MKPARVRLWYAIVLWAATGCAEAVGFNGHRGLWFDRAHPGHGIDVQQAGDDFLVIFYTFDAAGEPEWFASQGGIAAGVFDHALLRFAYDYAARTQRVEATVGTLRLRYDARADDPACAGVDRGGAAELVVLEAGIGAESLRWCLEPLVPAQILPASAMSGTWWGGPADSGWGLTSYFIPRDNALQSVHALYHFDAAGRARWSFAQASGADFKVEARWQSLRGYCRGCAPAAVVARDAGSMDLSLVTPLQDAGLGNRVRMQVSYPAGAGGRWDRDIELQRLSAAFPYGGTVATREGLVAPDIFLDDSNHDVYFGIPYAAPPTGGRRWRAPQPALPRTRVLEASAITPGCPQLPSAGFFTAAPASTSEDCLTLNVWVPAHPRQPPLPVMVWIHGGGLVQGSALQQAPASGLLTYDGSVLAARDTVVVSINYRLGALGFLALDALIGEHADYPAAGNYGFLDQVAALRWVRDNIARFGGDPDRVTIFGESAGGVSVCAHVASGLSRGLFHRAIMQSGNCSRNMRRLELANGTRESAVAQGVRVAQRLGCADDVAACMRARGAAEIVAAAQGTVGFGREGESFELTIDGHAFDRSIATALADGSAARVPFIIGVNQDEATTLLAESQRPPTAAAYEALVRASFPLIADAVLEAYPASAHALAWQAWAAIVTDVGFICPAQRAARDHAAQGAPAYAYYFTDVRAGELAPLGAFHGAEIPYLFNILALEGVGANALAERMRHAWSNFAAGGVPFAPGMPSWPAHPAQGALGMQLNGAGDRVVADYRKPWCDFWARYVAL